MKKQSDAFSFVCPTCQTAFESDCVNMHEPVISYLLKHKWIERECGQEKTRVFQTNSKKPQSVIVYTNADVSGYKRHIRMCIQDIAKIKRQPFWKVFHDIVESRKKCKKF